MAIVGGCPEIERIGGIHLSGGVELRPSLLLVHGPQVERNRLKGLFAGCESGEENLTPVKWIPHERIIGPNCPEGSADCVGTPS
jgi:hypothetical protein